MDPTRIGRYQIHRRLGGGGMGSLFLAYDPVLDRSLAIKLLRADYQDNVELRERFAREARSVARLRHPNIVVVFDVGEEDGRPFIAMEYIAGETLTTVLRRRPPLELVRRLALVEELCAGLAHAHAAGIIHRDIKPDNMMIDSDGVLKVLDFGIARLANSGMTQDGMMIGTVNYMSPEQIAGRGVDARSDIFAAGAVLYEVIALDRAFPGGIDSGVFHRIMTVGPVPLQERVPDVDSELAAVVERALDRDPDRRYPDATALRHDLARVRRRLGRTASEREAEPPPDRTIVRRTPTPAAGVGSGSASRRRLDPQRAAELRRQEVEEHLRTGEEALARGDYEAAVHQGERAATIDPDNREAFDLIDRARHAIDANVVRQLLAEAERLRQHGWLDQAAGIAAQASITVAPLADEALRREVQQLCDSLAEEQARLERIESLLQRARASLEHGGYDTALRAAYEVLALDPDRREARELEELAKARLKAQREREEARRAALDGLRSARAMADQGRYEEAAALIAAIEPVSDTVRRAAEDALADVRARQRQAADAAVMAAARAARDRGEFDEALKMLDTLEAPADANAAALRAAVTAAAVAHRELVLKRERLEEVLTSVRSSIDVGELAAARERLGVAAALGLVDDRIAALRRQLDDLEAAAAERRRQELRDRLAGKRVEAARQLSNGGDPFAAIALLERDASGHPAVAAALVEFRALVAEQEARAREQAERARVEEERRRAELEAARRRAEAERQQEEERRRQEAERRRQEAERRRQEDERRRLEEERRLEEARRREERRRACDELVSRGHEQIARAQLAEARESVEAALQLEPGDAAALDLLAGIEVEIERRDADARAEEETRRREQERLRREREERARHEREEEARAQARARQEQEDEERRQARAWQEQQDRVRREPPEAAAPPPEHEPTAIRGTDANRATVIAPSRLPDSTSPAAASAPRVRPVHSAIAAAAIGISALLVWLSWPPAAVAPPTPAAGSSSRSEPRERRPEPPATNSTGGTAVVPAPSPKPTDAERARAQQLEALRRRARESYQRGDGQAALGAVQSALQIDPNDRVALELRSRMVEEAADAMESAKVTAVKSGSGPASVPYATGLAEERTAGRERQLGRQDRALSAMWRATAHFAAAAEQARRVGDAPGGPGTPIASVPTPSPETPVETRVEPPTSGSPVTEAPAAPPSSPPAPTPLPRAVNDRAAIERTLRAYEAAWASLDADALARLQTFSADQLARVRSSMEAAREYRVSVVAQDVNIAPGGRQAAVVAHIRRVQIPKSAAKPTDISTTNVLEFQKRGDDWIIVAIR